MISAILLAAGASRRMGRPKQLLAWQGKPLLLHVLENVIDAGVDETILVLGHEAEQIRKILPELPIKMVVNPDYESGMASSLRQGLLAMDPASEAFLVLLADQPGIGPEVIDRVIREYRRAEPRRGIVRPLYRGVPGHPVLIGVQYRQEALQLQGDEGARGILRSHPEDVLEIDVDREVILMDLDTPEAYEKHATSAGSGAMTLERAFSIGQREVVSLIGGGGKTTLMYALGRELSSGRKGIVLTTTTKILEPSPSPYLHLFLSRNLGEVKRWVAENAARPPCLLIARERLAGGKLEGVPPEWVQEISGMSEVSAIVNEADGSAGRPLKAHREGEPVVPGNTSLLVPVLGIDGMGVPLREDQVFRSDIASRLLDVPMGSTVTEKIIVRLLKEWLRSTPAGARVVPLINKMDLPGGREKARMLVRELFASDLTEIRRVVLSRFLHPPSVRVIDHEQGVEKHAAKVSDGSCRYSRR